MGRVVIAGGTGAVGAALARRLSEHHEVLALRPPARGESAPETQGDGAWPADLSSIPDAEVALAGAETVVVLAQARRPPARLTRAALDDLDRLIADSLARAVRRVGARRVVVFRCGDDDVRLPLLAQAGVPLSVLSGGGEDPVAALAELVDAPPGTSRELPPWQGEAPRVDEPRLQVCSIQRYARPAGWTAEQLARAYFDWLPSAAPLTRVRARPGVYSLHVLGVRGLALRHLPGRSSDDSYVLQVADGALVRRTHPLQHLEFRVLLDGVTAMAALCGYEPSLPWPVYRISQALMHERVMRRFGEHLAQLAA